MSRKAPGKQGRKRARPPHDPDVMISMHREWDKNRARSIWERDFPPDRPGADVTRIGDSHGVQHYPPGWDTALDGYNYAPSGFLPNPLPEDDPLRGPPLPDADPLLGPTNLDQETVNAYSAKIAEIPNRRWPPNPKEALWGSSSGYTFSLGHSAQLMQYGPYFTTDPNPIQPDGKIRGLDKQTRKQRIKQYLRKLRHEDRDAFDEVKKYAQDAIRSVIREGPKRSHEGDGEFAILYVPNLRWTKTRTGQIEWVKEHYGETEEISVSVLDLLKSIAMPFTIETGYFNTGWSENSDGDEDDRFYDVMRWPEVGFDGYDGY